MAHSTGIRAGLRGIALASLAAATVVASPLAVAPAAALTSVPAAATTCVAGTASCPIVISFAPGALSGQRSAWLSGMSAVRWFSVRARAGQVMVVVVKGAGPTRGTVYFPNGARSGQPGGRVFDGALPVSGTYRIRVTESSMGTAWAGRVTVVVLIY